jgi:phthiocerol/phenolphthiocerol synthesis type-I polyketide synthase E
VTGRDPAGAPHAIAVVGMSGRFPGAPDVDALWANLVAGVESIGRFGAADLRQEGLSPALLEETGHVPAGGALDGIELFDAGFFGFTPREAEVLDPQHRIFLECAWEALERAGHPPSSFAGAIGVYAGAGPSTHLHRLLGSPEIVRLMGSLQISIGNDKDHLTTRTAYKLGLRGPAVTVQTTCSTSLVAVVLACQGLMTGQCDLALAGGVSVVMPQRVGYRYRSGGILSPDGHCRAFDADAAGTVGGNGAGVVALRRLDDALRDGDYVHAVLRGSAINNDGAVKVGYTAPSIDGQADVIRRALASAGLPPGAIGYVEAHGTGTSLGDPIEVAALTAAFGGASPGAEKTCRIGSLKTNIGHLDAAAGVAGLIKAILCLERDMLPPSLHYRTPNPELRLDETPFSVVTAPTPWPRGGEPRRAGVSSFGIGGTNAHVIVEEPPPRPRSAECPWPLLVLSARSAEAVGRAAAALADHLQQVPGAALADVAFTLQSGRHAFAHRRAVVVGSRAEAIQALRRQDRRAAAVAPERPPPVAFLFPGQGTQHPGMGGELHRTVPAFRAEVDACCEFLTGLLGRDLRELIAGGSQERPEAARDLRQTELAQPALFVTELALARYLQSLGVEPAAMLGHSVGELTAACIAGVLTRADALTLVAERGRLMAAMSPGAMLAVPLPEEVLRAMLPDGVEIAAVNAPQQCTVSGPGPAIARFAGVLAGRGVVTRHLPVSHGFHSAAMQPAARAFAQAAARVRLGPPRVPYLSNVTGNWITADQAVDPQAWGLHVRAPVRFADAARALLASGCVLVEAGPGATLGSLVRQCAPPDASPVTVTCLPGPGEHEPEERRLAEAVGRLWTAGVGIDWAAFAGDRPRQIVPLPTYPFERSRYWLDAPRRRSGPRAAAPAAAPVAGQGAGHGERRPPAEWLSVPSWRRAAPAAGRPARTRRMVLLADDGDVAARLAPLLTERGCLISVVAASSEIGSTDRPVDLRADAVVQLRGLDGGGGDPIARVRRIQDRGFGSVIALARALGAAPGPAARKVTLVTDRAVDVTGREQLRPEQATLHGLARVVAQEYPGLTCRTVDVVAADLADPDALGLLADELCADNGEPSVALRGRHRWLPGFELLEPDPGAPSRLRQGGTYLITGGLGRIGLALAEDLARLVRANLVLVARTGLPDRSRWGTIGDSDPRSATVRRLLAIERAGGTVLPAAADVADRDAMAGVLALAEQRFGALDGVVHAAGAVGPGAFAPVGQLDAGLIRAHFRPKIEGTLVIDELLGGRPLALAMLTSSLSAVLGGAGFGAYAAANAFLDAFAAGPGHGRWTSVGWDGWNFQPSPDPRGLARLALSPQEGTEVFRRLTALPPLPRVAVSTGDLPARVATWVQLDVLREQAPAPAASPASPQHGRPPLATDYAPPASAVERTVAEVWQELLGIAEIGRHDDFFALGGHSLLAIQIISRLRDTFEVELSLHGLFDGPTVAELAASIEEGRSARTGENERLAALLDLVEGLSEEEVEALLAAEDGGQGG